MTLLDLLEDRSCFILRGQYVSGITVSKRIPADYRKGPMTALIRYQRDKR